MLNLIHYNTPDGSQVGWRVTWDHEIASSILARPTLYGESTLVGESDRVVASVIEFDPHFHPKLGEFP